MKSNIATSLFTNNPPYVTLEGMGPIGVSGVQEKAVSYLLKNNYNFTLGQAEINQEQTPYINITNNLFYNTVIGNQIIKNLGNIVIDPFSKFIGVYPSNKVNESYTFTNFGIAPALIQDKIIIALIVPESKNVKTNNFLAGDVIKSVDGHTADFFKTQNELSNYFTENKKITIVTKEDKTVVLNQEVIL